ncbi:membrane protein YqaA with SNARE-associated domain [Halomonas cerina]|uniref:Membrane protein YqaA with SNARE-associated domain n=1 Tax=Halomonas cerina TaxID=447424 RepID=A0A839V5E4_9GAMM|nr:membrane protein YqaA with SNARE-associated domain [Halomonas cerina]
MKLTSARTWLDRLDRSPHALWLLFVASMMETLAVPIPIETILIPWMLCHPYRKWTIASVALAGNLTAAALGFHLGILAMEQWRDAVINIFGGQAAYEDFQARLQQEGFMALLAVGIVPIPFQTAMLVAGASGYSFVLFMLAALLARGTRYFGLAILVALVGDAALRLWRRYSTPLGLIGVVLFGVWMWFQLAP